MVRAFLCIIIAVSLSSCQTKWEKRVSAERVTLVKEALIKAGANEIEIRESIENAPKEQQPGIAFLIAYMPEKDLQTLSAGFILENAEWAYKARKNFSWCKDLPEEIFFNEVLPFANLQETRDNWRPDFYNRFEPYVRDCKDVYAAIDSVNRNIRDELLVDYNTKRSRVDISPFQAIKEQMATCTGLSFLLVDAFRSVGIPARLAGTKMWTNMRGNHSWVEVWIDGEWYFTEYYPDALNKSWFVADAGKADPEKPLHWVYAVSYKPGDCYFPMSWSRRDSIINAVNVTDRYIALYEEQLSAGDLNDDEVLVDLVLYKDTASAAQSSGRVHRKISIRQDGAEVTFGFSPSPTDDLNKFLIVKLNKNNTYQFEIYDEDRRVAKEVSVTITDEPSQLVNLYLE